MYWSCNFLCSIRNNCCLSKIDETTSLIAERFHFPQLPSSTFPFDFGCAAFTFSNPVLSKVFSLFVWSSVLCSTIATCLKECSQSHKQFLHPPADTCRVYFLHNSRNSAAHFSLRILKYYQLSALFVPWLYNVFCFTPGPWHLWPSQSDIYLLQSSNPHRQTIVLNGKAWYWAFMHSAAWLPSPAR